MDINNLQLIWQQHEEALKANRNLNLSLLREVKLDKAKSSLKSLLFLPVSTMIFYILMSSYFLYFSVVNWEVWYFALSGMILMMFSLLLVVSSIRQLKQMLSIDYNDPIIKLQKDLSKLKSSIVDNFRIANWMLPFFPAIVIFLFKILFDFDLVAHLPAKALLIYAGIVLIFIGISIYFSRILSPKNINSKAISFLLRGGGSQVDEALKFIDQIKAFEGEE